MPDKTIPQAERIMAKKTIHKQDSLEKLLRYILGLRPDEFGLHPDQEGFVPLKALLAALHDEEGWRGVREGQINMLANLPGGQAAFEVQEGLVRLKPALASLPPEKPDLNQLPKMLYAAFKPTAWPVIAVKGLFPKAGEEVVRLWADKEMAQKTGRRLSPEPVLITVRSGAAREAGAVFTPYSELLWLTTDVSPRFLIGPPVPPKEEESPSRRPREKPPEPAGSFHLGPPDREIHQGKKKGKRSDSPDWKNQTRRDRRRQGRDD